MLHPEPILRLLALLAVANGTPVLLKKLLGDFAARPLDGGARLPDGEPVLGPSKTVRGIVASLIVTTCLAPFFGIAAGTGAIVAAAAMAGDLLSSFVKRRLHVPPSGQSVGLDQIPESLLPALACRWALPLSALDVVLVVALFLVGELAASRLLYALRIRDRPY
jgi:hypothetical protein